MIKIERTYPYYCCNSCGKQDSDAFPILMVKTGIDGGKVTTATSYCRECLKTITNGTGKCFSRSMKESIHPEDKIMNKLRNWIETWIEGKQVRGIKNVPPTTIWELVDIYNAIVRKEKPSFIDGKAKEILDKCEIETIVEGIGWRIA